MKKVLATLLCLVISIVLYIFVNDKGGSSHENTQRDKIASSSKKERLTIDKITKPIIEQNQNKYRFDDIPEKCQFTFKNLDQQLFYQELTPNTIKTSLECLEKHLLSESRLHLPYLRYQCSKKTLKINPKGCMEVMLGIKGAILKKSLKKNLNEEDVSSLSDQELVSIFLAERVLSHTYDNKKFTQNSPIFAELYNRFPSSHAVNTEILLKFSTFNKDSQLFRLVVDYFEENHPNDSAFLNVSYYLTNDFSKKEKIFTKLTSKDQSSISYYKSHALSIWSHSSKAKAIEFINKKLESISGSSSHNEQSRKQLTQFITDLNNNRFTKNTTIKSYRKLNFLDLIE